MKELSTEESLKIMVDILKRIADFCEEHSINYFLGFGTMIGAVRHHGMIPWDYDIDVLMPRNDYERFIRLFNEKNTDKDLEVLSRLINREYKGKICRVRNIKTINLNLGNSKRYDAERSVCVEVYPIDGMNADPKKQKEFQRKMRLLLYLYLIKTIKFRKGRKIYKSILLCLMKAATLPITIDYILDKIEKMNHKYPIDESEFIAIPAASNNLDKVVVPKDVISDKIMMPYEGYEMPVPKGYDIWLRSLYGDYMKLPPEEEIKKSMQRRNYYIFGLIEDKV